MAENINHYSILSNFIDVGGHLISGSYSFSSTPANQYSSHYTRNGNKCKFFFNSSYYLTNEWSEGVRSHWLAWLNGASYTPQAMYLYTHLYNNKFIVTVGLSPHADVNDNLINGRLHIGRTSLEKSFMYDSWFVVDLIDPVTYGEIKFKFPVNRNEIIERWFTLTLSVSDSSSDFHEWTGWEAKNKKSTHFCRFCLTNSNGTIFMDANNSHFHNNDINFKTIPWNGIFKENRKVHNIRIGDLQWDSKNNVPFTPTPPLVTGNASWTNLWISEGDFLDPKINYNLFTNNGTPKDVSTKIGSVKADIHIPLKSLSDIMVNDNFFYLTDHASNIKWRSEYFETEVSVKNIIGPSV